MCTSLNSKPFNYAIALDLYGAEYVNQYIGQESKDIMDTPQAAYAIIFVPSIPSFVLNNTRSWLLLRIKNRGFIRVASFRGKFLKRPL